MIVIGKPENEEAEGDLFDNRYPLNENNADVTDWSASRYQNIYNDFMNIPKALDIMNNEKAYSEGGPMFISNKKTGKCILYITYFTLKNSNS